ncbi:hypothetical protein HN682_06810 [Candidatus Peregrinibacteria bacterium]|jgi:hypothetical protein|nr:hypothetical protein [Candidatus Peregrinibacteria bacterium]
MHKLTVRGNHKGKPLDKVPLTYLDWLIGQEWMGFKYTEDARAIKLYLADPVIARELNEILAERQQREEERDY